MGEQNNIDPEDNIDTKDNVHINAVDDNVSNHDDESASIITDFASRNFR
jgi:hypothetical protein